MQRRWIGLTVGALILAFGSFARADDVGCCQAACSVADGSGVVGGSVTRGDMTQAECESRFSECDTTWRPEACAAHPEVGGSVGFGGKVPGESPE
jgi:hypothetical protein